MVKKHHFSVFSATKGLIINSDRNDLATYMQMTRKKQDGTFEKLSSGEGINVKFNLKELVSIKMFFTGEKESWNAFHRFNGNATKIFFTGSTTKIKRSHS